MRGFFFFRSFTAKCHLSDKKINPLKVSFYPKRRMYRSHKNVSSFFVSYSLPHRPRISSSSPLSLFPSSHSVFSFLSSSLFFPFFPIPLFVFTPHFFSFVSKLLLLYFSLFLLILAPFATRRLVSPLLSLHP